MKLSQQVVNHGQVISMPKGRALHTLPAYDLKHVERSLKDYYSRYMSIQVDNMRVEHGFDDVSGYERFINVPVNAA